MACERGHRVTVLARHPPKVPFDPAVRLVLGDALSPDVVDAAVADQDAVIYAVGPSGTGATTLFSESTRILLASMSRHRVQRLIAITGVGAGETKGHGGWLYDRLIYPLFTRRVYADKDRQEALIRASSLEWTIVRPAVFNEGRKTGSSLRVVVEVAGVTLRSISRAEVARFVLDQVESPQYLRQAAFIGHP
jgi:putative NADH-flavin reductase